MCPSLNSPLAKETSLTGSENLTLELNKFICIYTSILSIIKWTCQRKRQLCLLLHCSVPHARTSLWAAARLTGLITYLSMIQVKHAELFAGLILTQIKIMPDQSLCKTAMVKCKSSVHIKFTCPLVSQPSPSKKQCTYLGKKMNRSCRANQLPSQVTTSSIVTC